MSKLGDFLLDQCGPRRKFSSPTALSRAISERVGKKSGRNQNWITQLEKSGPVRMETVKALAEITDVSALTILRLADFVTQEDVERECKGEKLLSPVESQLVNLFRRAPRMSRELALSVLRVPSEPGDP